MSIAVNARRDAILKTEEIQECRLKPKDRAIVKVTDDNQVNDNTEFID